MCIFCVRGKCLNSLFNSYIKTIDTDINQFHSTIIQRNIEEILLSKVYSEVEGSLQVENVPTTRTRIEQIYKGAALQSKKDIIIKNMIEAMQFVLTKPDFTKANLCKLYSILSKDCLNDDQVLNGNFYRDDAVYIGKYDGCPAQKIDECINSLFLYANNVLKGKSKFDSFLLPHICHYYLLYIHPYFDYNGRTARMVSFWISLLASKEYAFPLYLSEAINDNKKLYYDSISETRDMDNDLSYFLIYIFNTAIRYSLEYQNEEYICDLLLKKTIMLTNIEKVYLKKILLKTNSEYFDYKKFLEYANVDITKQAAFKILNKFEEYGILLSTINKKKIKFYQLNKNMINIILQIH